MRSYCPRCRRQREFQQAVRAAEIGGGAVITWWEDGWECPHWHYGYGFGLFSEPYWSQLKQAGLTIDPEKDIFVRELIKEDRRQMQQSNHRGNGQH